MTINADTNISISDSNSSIAGVAADNNAAVDVYSLQGVLIISNATPERIAALPAGLYIIGNKKVVINK